MMELAINGRFLLQDVTGVQRVAIEFVRALDEMLSQGLFAELETTILVPRAGELVTELSLNSIRIHRAGRLAGHAWEQIELPRLAGRSVLLCLGNTAPVSRLLAQRLPTFTLVHDLSYKYFPSAYSRSFRLFYSLVMPIVLARSTHVFTVSRSEKDSLLRHFPRSLSVDTLTSVQNGGGEAAIGAQLSSEPLTLQPGAPNVPALEIRSPFCLYVGSLTKRKNGAGLIRAAVKLVEALDICFVFVGATGAHFEAIDADAPESLRDRIVFLGQLNQPAQIEQLYRAARVLVFPSFYEASPLPPIEAMSYGCPVVCSDIPSLRERCGEAALYCDPAEVTSIVEQVSLLLSDGILSTDLQIRGLEQARKFTWKHQVVGVMEVLMREQGL